MAVCLTGTTNAEEAKMKTIKRMKRIVKMGVILSIAAIAFTAYSASASALQPAFDEDMIIDLDDLFSEELIILLGSDVDVEASGCLHHWMGPEGINITVTNNDDGANRYEVFVYNGSVEMEETPEFTFPEEETWSDSRLLFSEDTFEFQYRGTVFTPSAAVVRVKVTEGPLVLMPGTAANVIFDEEITVCEYKANAMLSEAAEEYAAAEALAEAEAQAEAAAEALAEAEAQAQAQAQAQAEAEALEADLAAAEQSAADAQSALESMIDAVAVDVEDYSTELEEDLQTETDVVSSNNQPLVEGESAIGELTEGKSDDSGLSIGMILLVTIIGVTGIASAGVALQKMYR